MNIHELNQQNYCTMFQGNLRLKGKWTPNLQNAFVNSPYIKALLEGEEDIVARVKSHKITYREAISSKRFSKGDIIYKIYISLVKDSFFSRLSDFLGLSRKIGLTMNYYLEQDMIDCIDEDHYIRLRKQLKRSS